jgi:hypothetical protein
VPSEINSQNKNYGCIWIDITIAKNVVEAAYQINWSKPDITGTSFSLRLTLSTILATILQV